MLNVFYMVSSELYKIIPLMAGILAVLGGLLIKETNLRVLYFVILIITSMKIYEYLKKKELGYVIDEREYKYYLEAFRYSFIVLLFVFFILWVLNDIGRISVEFYLGFSTAFFILLIAHFVIHRVLLWLK